MIRYKLKIVPEARPNADGKWVYVHAEDPPETANGHKILPIWQHFEKYLPEGYFMVQYEKAPVEREQVI